MPPPIVNIGIPAYRRPDYIVEAIESVLAQSLEDWTLTISEDSDGTTRVRDVVAPYLTDPRIAYRLNEVRLGQSPNWTSLIREGDAAYVALLHDDDRWADSEYLARRVAFLDAHPECGLVFARTREIDEAGKVIGVSRFSFREGVIASEEIVPLLVRRNVLGHPPSIVVRRSAYEAVGSEFRTIVWEDYEMWFRIALRFPLGFLDVCDADYRVHAESLTTEYASLRKDHLALIDHVVGLARAERPAILSWAQRRHPHADMALAVALDELGSGDVRASGRFLVDAVTHYPPAVLDRRVAAWALGVLGGRRGRGVVARVRRRVKARRRSARGAPPSQTPSDAE